MRMTGIAFLLLVSCPVVSRAQSNPYESQMRATAVLRSPSHPFRQPLRVAADVLSPRRFNSRTPGATLMIIGGGAIVAGALVGGSGGALLILGGVGVGAYGFYLYTR
jgi:hypothetical protein